MEGLENLRVLLVEDNKHMRSIVSAVLSSVGIRHIRAAPDGASALETLKDWTPDLAIVDFQMQHMDGVEFTRAVRAAQGKPHAFLPIIMLTGHSERSRVFDARDAGVTEFVAKPLSAKALLNRLEAIICRPRAFVGSPSYFGPDRRRRAENNHRGPWLRSSDRRELGL